MEFTDREVELLRHVLAIVSADSRRAARLFYENLFRNLPETRDLFVADITHQGDKLMATLNAVIIQIESWSAIEAQIEELGLRHVAYGVLPEHYAPTGEALRTVLVEVLGPDFTEECEEAWSKAYNAISDTMIAAINRRMTTVPEARLND
jgi:nitric oxide dioxygenase